MRSSLVHNKETSGRKWLDGTFQDHIVKGNIEAFEKAIDFYRAIDYETGSHRALRAMDCHCNSWFSRNNKTGQVRVMSTACHLRWCYICSTARRAYISQSISTWIKAGRYRKFMTLTLKHSDDSLASQIDKIYSSFQKLKKTKLFKSKVNAGVWFFQVKRSKQSGQWHPHIHCVVSGKYLPRRQLSDKWFQITKDSMVADIRMVKDADKAANEVARYASAPANIETTSPIDYVEIFEALHKRRIAGTWGLKGKVTLTRPAADDKNEWQKLGSWSLLQCQEGDGGAADAIIKAWRKNEPLDEGVTLNVTDIEQANGYGHYYMTTPVKYQMDLFSES